jgi:hypothetical protein
LCPVEQGPGSAALRRRHESRIAKKDQMRQQAIKH